MNVGSSRSAVKGGGSVVIGYSGDNNNNDSVGGVSGVIGVTGVSGGNNSSSYLSQGLLCGSHGKNVPAPRWEASQRKTIIA